MTDDQKQTNQPQISTQEDLEEHGVQDIIPENEEYYTLNLQRDFDGDNSEETAAEDIAGSDPLSNEQDKTVSANGKVVQEGEAVDEDNEDGVRVGDSGHWGIDEDTA